MKYSDDQINKLLDGIFDGSITDHALPEDLYHAIADHLKGGLYNGFGKDLSQAEGKDLALLAELRDNVYMFGAAKTYQETKAISEKLLDADGNIRSRSDFLEEGRKMFDTWNDDWGKSEFNTAIAMGTMASKWNDIQDRKDLFPLLRYSTIGDACDICAPLDGLTAPVDDPIWDDVYPANHFNCRCTVLQEDENTPETDPEERDAIMEKVLPEMDDVFKNNVGKTGSVFPADHPYFSNVPKADQAFAENNFDLPIPPAEEEGQYIFKEAKDMKEVVARILATGVGKVSLTGMDLDRAQGVLHAFEKEAQYGKLNLSRVSTYEAPKSNANAMYQPDNGKGDSIRFNRSAFGRVPLSETGLPLTWKERIADLETWAADIKENYLGNPKYSQTHATQKLAEALKGIRALKDAEAAGEISRPWSISSLGGSHREQIFRTATHELGHYRHVNTLKLRSAYYDPRFKYVKANSITEYGRKDLMEFFTEWFTKYRIFGEKELFGEGPVPEDIIKMIKDIK